MFRVYFACFLFFNIYIFNLLNKESQSVYNGWTTGGNASLVLYRLYTYPPMVKLPIDESCHGVGVHTYPQHKKMARERML